jgi:hypothetical protein
MLCGGTAQSAEADFAGTAVPFSRDFSPSASHGGYADPVGASV